MSSGFFKGQKSGSQGHRKPMQKNIICDGVRPYNTFATGYSEVRSPKPRHHAKHKQPAFTYSFYPLPDGREGMTPYHYDHPLGSCEDCRNTVVRRTKDGKIYAEPGQSEADCCIL
jgi:hypothetical protein